MRTFNNGPVKYCVIAMGVFISLFHLYTARYGVYPPYLQRGIHLAILLPLAFLLYPATKKSPRDKITILDGILAILAFLPSLYVVLERTHLEQRLEFVTPVKNIEIVLGTIMVLLVLEAVRRAVSPVMATLVTIFLIYLPVGAYLSGALQHRGFSYSKMIEAVYLLTGEGLYGVLMGVSATHVIVFIIFGSFIEKTGIGKFFGDFARAIAGGSQGGPAKIATISSALFGTLTGSAVANVYTTGSFTIPLMKRRGFRPQFAGAVEAAASTGGQLMPPIMGAAAFIMAENLQIPYVQVALQASIIAILYYFSIVMMIHFGAQKEGLAGEPKSELPTPKQVLRDFYLFIPVALLLYLLISGYSPLYAGFTSIISAVVVSYFKKESRMTPAKIVDALVEGAKNGSMLVAAMSGAGIIVVAVTHTGLGLAFSSLVIALSGGVLFLALILVALSSIILGMGIPTTAAYIIVAALGVPALVKMGVNPFAAHMFAFYFAVISNITPPVAIAAYAGANLAGSDPMKTGVEASLIASAAYIVPFMFAYNPVLLLQGTGVEILQSTITAFLGVSLLAAGIQGWFKGCLEMWMRLAFIVAALGLVHWGTATDIIALVIFAVIYIIQRSKLRTETPSISN
jgi:TRAP transporter 4TM/12TM fusion protein